MGFLKGERKPMRTRFMQVALLGGVLLLVLAGCGRVNLEDLTPEAVKTQQAEAAITQTAQAEAAAEAGSDLDGNPARGDVLYGTWCINCHDGGLAEPIRGNTYPFSEWEEFFRTGGDIDHPAYDPFVDLSDQNLIDILTYIAQS
jgi:mono/diheme cytochrome c family protein